MHTINRQFSNVAVSLESNVVPVSIVQGSTACGAHNHFTTAAVETELHPTFDHFQRGEIDSSGSVHDG
jgi:hypothetical protein